MIVAAAIALLLTGIAKFGASAQTSVQPGEPRPVRAGLQPGELPAPVRSSNRGVPLVAIKHPVEARENWGQDYQSLKDDRLPDGGGRCS